MKIVCCIKQVPIIEHLKFDPERRAVVRSGVDLVVNTYDRRAVTEAITIKKRLGAAKVEVIVITMGPPEAREALVECLAMGADRAVHLLDPAFAGADTLATARALSRAAQREGFDLLLFGQFALDAETGQVGPETAALLRLPCITNVRRVVLAADGASAEVEHEVDDGHQVVRTPLPALLTVLERLNRPLRTTPDGFTAARNATIQVLSPADLGLTSEECGAAGSPTWVSGLEIVQPNRPAEVVSGLSPRDAAARLADYLEANGLWEAQAAASEGAALPERQPDAGRPAVWVLVEPHGEGLRSVTLELLGKANALAADLGGEVVALVLGEVSEAQAAELAGAGADRILTVPSAAGDDYGAQRRGVALAEVLRSRQPSVVLAPSTNFGREVTARAAALLGLGLTADCLDVALNDEGRLVQHKPAFGGNVVALILSHTTPQVATLRPGVAPRPRPRAGATAPVEAVEIGDLPVSGVVLMDSQRDLGEAPHLLERAGVVIGVGTGIEGDWNLPMVQELADLVGGALGGTRRATDAKLLPGQQQIGLTGKSISPSIYLALGVRGNLNHMIGVQRAGKIVAVNLDPDADIMKVCDLGIEGDVLKIVPLLTAELRTRKQKRSGE